MYKFPLILVLPQLPGIHKGVVVGLHFQGARCMIYLDDLLIMADGRAKLQIMCSQHLGFLGILLNVPDIASSGTNLSKFCGRFKLKRVELSHSETTKDQVTARDISYKSESQLRDRPR